MNSFKKAAVLYHYPCPDGAFAALAAHLYFSAASLPVAFFPNPVYDPIRVNNLPLDEISDIYLLDFIGASGFVAEVSSKVDSVTILDHHKTALETISENASALTNVSKVIDIERSGATIAYDYFNEKLLKRGISFGNHGAECDGKFLPENKVESVQRLFKFIEDGDLWRWKLSHSKAFSSGLADMKIEYNVNVNSSLFDQLMDLDPELVISHGKETLVRKQKLIDLALDQSYEIALGSIGAVVYKVPELKNDQLLKISLRSIEMEDTTAISKEYGGGGHRNASSFILSAGEFLKWKV